MLSKLKEKIKLNKSTLHFDDLENIANREDECDNRKSMKVNYIYGNHNTELFTKRNPTSDKTIDNVRSNVFSSFGNGLLSTKGSHRVTNENTENIHPNSNNIAMERKTSFNKLFEATVQSHLRETEIKKDTHSNLPRNESELDNRFASSRHTNSNSPNTKKTQYFEQLNTDQNLTTSVTDGDEVDQSINEDDESDALEELFSKVRHNRVDYVESAIRQNNFDMRRTDEYGNTVLHVCAQNNNKKIASLLLEHDRGGSSSPLVNACNAKGLTSLDYAEKYGFHKLAAFLASKGATSGTQISGAPNATKATQFR